VRRILLLVAVAATFAAAAAADAASSKRFVSKRYHYSIVLPAAWTETPASTGWQGGPPFDSTTEVDLFDKLSDGRSMAVAARSIPRAFTLRKWATTYVRAAVPSFCKKSRGYRTTTLGDAPALAFTAHCEVHDITLALSVHGGQGYTFILASPSFYAAGDDGAIFETSRRSFRFVP
jgi:hypothetical protein